MKLYGSLSQLVAAIFRKDSNNITLRPNQSVTYNADRDVQLPEENANSVLVSKTSPDILTNKSISGSSNTLSNIPNNATTAASANTPSAIVARDGSGNFSAGTITADLVGNASTATSATSATSFTGSLSGEVTGTQSATVVADNVIDNDNIKSTAAIAYSKLALTGSILNADLAGSIDAAKIGSGSVSNAEFGYLDGVTSSIQTQLGGKAASGANSDITSLSGLTTALSIGQGGTGQTSASAAINALLPAQGSSTGKYLKTDGSNVSWASASGGAGEINAVLNSSGADGLTGWVEDAPHSISVSTATTIPLYPALTTAFNMSSSASIAIAAQNKDSGIYYEFTMPPALRNRKLKLEFYFNSPASADGTWGVAVYNGATKVRLSTDTGATPDTVLPAGVTGGKFTAYLDTDAGTTYRVNLVQRTRTITNNLVVTNVIVGPGIQPQGAVVGEWTSYTPTGSWTTNTTYTGRYRRVGDTAEITIDVALSGAPNSGRITFTQAQFLNGLGLTVNNAALPNTTDTNLAVGTWAGLDSGVLETYGGTISMSGDANKTLVLGYSTGASTSAPVTNTTPISWGASDNITIKVAVPIAEWAGSGTVQLAQNDVEYASNNSPTATTNDTTNFVYGPSGSSIPTVVLSGNITKQVRFQTPIQTGDTLTLEVFPSNGFGWVPVIGGVSADSANRTIDAFNAVGTSGIGSIKAVSATDAIVTFGRYRSSTGNWTEITESVKWRVRKSSAGAAVGFGIVQPGTSAGLVSASGLPGNTTGNAIASGYVGEVVSVNLSKTPTSLSAWQGWADQTVTLSAGHWIFVGTAFSAGNANITNFQAAISSNSNNDATGFITQCFFNGPANANASAVGYMTGATSYKISTSTPVYMKTYVVGGLSTCSFVGCFIRIA